MRLASSSRAPRTAGLSRPQLIVLIYGLLAIAAWVTGTLLHRPNIYILREVTTPSRALISPMIGFAFGLLFVGACRIAVKHLRWVQVLHQEFRHVVGVLNHHEILLLAFSSAVGEELFFRGALLQKPHSLLLSSLAFAALHIRPQARFLPWTALSFAIGLVFGAMFLWLGDLSGPIASHFTINLLNLHFIADNDLRK